ncbi:MAG: hypothetical protein UU37_C0001G0038 [Candidatus Gottesmanbacteria bacterium GW2011_GWA2_41_12]|uniref:DNA recombination protein RmuC n=2 Tax=Candidatus Gottesmaniibacteriota TaxID=1752720 RepID=A0A0G0UIK6_9BACT|nr:MAG: hypothetical protein UT63_C0005G0004 [Candidatus Gottesmanbacteria bacterium GW2011_GWC2_39_8]KKR88619.1 MAG: hypothetical protein UU37_C0001G0038 [Candidatus Gottesmanbacteria bacterium GW2011_GWA2_41_12]
MQIDTLFPILIIILCFLFLLVILKIWLDGYFRGQKPSEELVEWLKNTNLRIDQQNKNITATLQKSTDSLNERLDTAARYIGQVQKNIGEMSEIGRGMKDLQEFLRSPKLRGNIGEHILKELLGQMLPKASFNLQYSFKSGAIVDAAIKTGNGIIPIDSKFPMESFRKMMGVGTDEEKKLAEKDFARDIKKHIDSISAKYILTEEGTIDYALMYLPSEAVYYEVINNNDLFDYCNHKKILPVSPMTFYAYLRAILMSFEGQKIEEQAKKILTTIKALQKDYSKTEESLNTLQRHLTNAYNQIGNVFSSFHLIGQKIASSSFMEIEKKETKTLEI